MTTYHQPVVASELLTRDVHFLSSNLLIAVLVPIRVQDLELIDRLVMNDLGDLGCVDQR
ncbi:hypothetical protein IWX65_002967 [Arthrobacter sp. CAN_A214]|uniref:hypothetical protein n=1 Tax=Arthrobacter sp. CAN_A214 TaxID=2787720 RepID=UPI0018CBECB8